MMRKIKRILFATDLSENARYAFTYAADISARYDADMVILHVTEDIPHNTEALIINTLGRKKWEELSQENRKSTQEVLIGKMSESKMIRLALSGLTEQTFDEISADKDKEVEIVVQSGNVVEQIIAQSESKCCDMIVIAYVPKNMVEKLFAGSVYRKVLRRSNKPVLLVPMPDNAHPCETS